jgi:hypothetical protein
MKLNANVGFSSLERISLFDFQSEQAVSYETYVEKIVEREKSRYSAIEINQRKSLLEFKTELEQLLSEDYDEEFLKPTRFALTTMMSFLLSLSQSFSPPLPIPHFIPDGEGGLRAEWERFGKEIRLVCPSDGSRKPYLYFELGDSYDLVRDISNAKFVGQFKWLLKID